MSTFLNVLYLLLLQENMKFDNSYLVQPVNSVIDPQILCQLMSLNKCILTTMFLKDLNKIRKNKHLISIFIYLYFIHYHSINEQRITKQIMDHMGFIMIIQFQLNLLNISSFFFFIPIVTLDVFHSQYDMFSINLINKCYHSF